MSSLTRKPLARITAVLTAVALLAGTLSACGSSNSATASDNLATADGTTLTTLTVGVCAGPYGEMVTDVISPLLEKEGYKLETQEFTDYVQPNKALASGSIDANLFQHSNYFNKFVADNDLDLTIVGQVPTLGLGIYSKTYTSLDDLPDGATVAIAADASNLARSLGILQQVGLVTLKGEVDATKATVDDIADNPKNLTIKTIEAAQLARALDSVDISLVPGNYSWAADLDPADALALEKQDDGVINVFAIRTADVDTDFGKKITDLLTSQEFKDAIAESRFADFGKPAFWGTADAASSSSPSASATESESATASPDATAETAEASDEDSESASPSESASE